MEKISEFLIDHWIIVLTINTIAIVFIIGYLIEQSKKKKKNTSKEEKIIFDNTKQKVEENIIDNGTKILANNIENNEINQNIVEEKQETSSINDENIQEFTEETKQQLQDNIDKIINQSNSVFEEFDKVIPDKKIISDEIKKELETFETIEPIKETKKSVYIDTDIELPEITLKVQEEDIWS